MLSTRPRICFLAAVITTASTPEVCIHQARQRLAVTEKITALRTCIRDNPLDPLSRMARDQLIMLLSATNRYDEALREQRLQVALRQPSGEPDLKLLELLLKTGKYAEVLRLTANAPNNGHDVIFDERLFELRVQAFLAQGKYQAARQSLDQWLGMHGHHGEKNTRFAEDVRNLQHLRRYILILERREGPAGKPLFTASVPDSLKRWSRRRDVPITFFKLLPANPSSQPSGTKLYDHHPEINFRRRVEDMNIGFRYLSGGNFSLVFSGLHTLYVKASELDYSGSRSNLMASRVYVHTIPPLYRQAGRAFVVLVDYRIESDGEASYMGDGLIHIAANKLNTMTLMHEVLHGLGATHQEWNRLESRGYRFDPDDRGLMTFEKGKLRTLGLEEKNRVLLDWPKVAAMGLPDETAELSTIHLLPTYILNH